MKTKRTPTLCEWALGFNVEDYLDQQDRRQRRQGKPQQRFCVEVSTDDESEEDSLKITYPRSSANGNNGNNGNGNSTGVKKVRFERGPQPKSAMRRTDSEQSDSDTSGSNNKGSGRSSADSSRSYGGKKKSSSDSFDADSSGQGQKQKSNKKNHASDTDSSDSCEECKRRSEGNTDEFGSQKGANNSGKKERNKKKKVTIEVSEEDKGDNEASDNDDDGDRQTNKKNKDFDSRVGQGSNGGKCQKSKGKSGKQHQAKTSASDAESLCKDDSEAQGGSKKKKGQAGSKMRPEATISPGMRRPNLIMPVSAQVLQVEHAIEGVEDPRPNAFHDGEHGVVRVYHGPAYGNPYGVLYPRRNCSDVKQGSLPLGTPHPLSNPYFHGFARSVDGAYSNEQGQNPWDAVPVTSMPTHDPLMATAGIPQTHAPWAQDTLAGRDESQATPAFSTAVMSGALQSDGLAKKSEKDQGWSAGIPPTQGYPINVNMYSYAGRPDPWSPEGRERYANLNKKNSSGNHNTRNIFQMMDGSLENNRGPAMYDRDGNQKGSDKGSNRGQQPGSVHPELQWSPRPKPAEAATASWVDQTGTAPAWGAAGDATIETNNENGKTAGGENWGATWEHGSNTSKNGQPNSMLNESAAESNGWDILPNLGSSNHSGSSKGSKRSNRSGGLQGADNNVGPPPDGAAGGSSTAQDAWGNDQSWSQPNGTSTANRMPGAWGADSGTGDRSGGGGGDNVTWHQTAPADTGGFSWGDTSAAQGAQW